MSASKDPGGESRTSQFFMENSKSAERWALVTAVPSPPRDLDLKIEGGVGGKTEPWQRWGPGCGDQRRLSPPSVLLTPTAGGGVLAVCRGTLPLWGLPGEVQGLGGKLSWWFGDPQACRSDQSVPSRAEPWSLMTPDCESVLGHWRVSLPLLSPRCRIDRTCYSG